MITFWQSSRLPFWASVPICGELRGGGLASPSAFPVHFLFLFLRRASVKSPYFVLNVEFGAQ